MTIERRYTSRLAGVRVENRVSGRPVIIGYAAVFYDPNDKGTEYQLGTDIVERVAPGAFDRAIREDDVRGLFNHDANKRLSRDAVMAHARVLELAHR
ncbi:MAG TPA: HK97 family phage prohead protease [Gemmataceae bacterium]|nr:HK97 family phage prohead protease [Gemmataceae bacterium]